MRSWLKFKLLGLLITVWVIPIYAQTLEKLEEIASRYSSLADFLADEKALAEYRAAYAAFVGEKEKGGEFAKVWKEFLGQLRAVHKFSPEFSAQVWQPNPRWRETEFKLVGENKGSGLVANRELLLEKMDLANSEFKEQAESILRLSEDKRARKVQSLVDTLKTSFQLRTPQELAEMSRPEKIAYGIRVGGDRQSGQKGIAENPSAKMLGAYLAHWLIEKNEGLRDYLFSGDADMTDDAITRLTQLTPFSDFFATSGKKSVGEILSYLSLDSPTLKEIQSAYSRGIEGMKAIRHIKDATPSAALRTRLQELAGEEVDAADVPDHLSKELKREYDRWGEAAGDIRMRKVEAQIEYSSPLFSIEMTDDEARKTLRLTADAPATLTYVAAPRPFHLLLAGRRNRECVGGGICGQLVPKRWARAALKGDRSYFSLLPDRRMEGFIGLTQVTKTSDATNHWILDLGSRATKGVVVLKNDQGTPIKYTFFDALIDHLYANGELGEKPSVIVSDGDTVSANVGGAELLQLSQAYGEQKRVGMPADFAPADDLANRLSKKFPQTHYAYGAGGFIYDGMKNDGENVYELVPRAVRRMWDREELEMTLYGWEMMKKPIQDWIWIKAFESGVRLGPAKTYQDLDRAVEYFSNYLNGLAKRYKSDPALMPTATELKWINQIADYGGDNRRVNQLVDSDLIDVLLEKSRRGIGQPIATQILKMPVLREHAQPEKVTQVALENLALPDTHWEARDAAAEIIAKFSGNYKNYPRFESADFVQALAEALGKRGRVGGSPEDKNADYRVAVALLEILRRASEPRQALNDLVLPKVSEVLSEITSRPRLLREKYDLAKLLIGILIHTLKWDPAHPAPVSPSNILAIEKVHQTSIEDDNKFWLIKSYVDSEIAAHPGNSHLSSSPLQSIYSPMYLAWALAKHPLEPRLQTPWVWNYLADSLREGRKGLPEESKAILDALKEVLRVKPNSTAFEHKKLIKEIRLSKKANTRSLIAHLDRKPPSGRKKTCDPRFGALRSRPKTDE